MEERTVKIALTGAGNLARQYAEIIASGKVPGMELTAITARNDAAKAWAAEALPPSVAVFGSPDALFGEPELYDSVLASAPYPAQYEDVLKAFALGKNVLCDKPVSRSVARAREMTLAAEKSGKAYGAMMFKRVTEKYAHISQVVRSGILGKILRVSFEISDAFRTAAFHQAVPFRSTWTGEGGGCLVSFAQNPLDIYCWLFGMPERVSAHVRFGKYNTFAVDDEAAVLMEHADGMTGTFFYTTGEAPMEDRLTVVGTQGVLRMDYERIAVRTYEDSQAYLRTSECLTREEMRFDVPTSAAFPKEKPYHLVLRNFADHVLYGTPLVAPGKEGERPLEIAAAAYLSAWSGSSVLLPVDSEVYREELEKRILDEQDFEDEGEPG
ncbi:MAG: Gfo/Idh/MocA family oxidoreductase [Lachnospiraceae bacterium]|nr:Gfo/Idh/MocA family oxidoreductase [Lachnospiraceae bacterium]